MILTRRPTLTRRAILAGALIAAGLGLAPGSAASQSLAPSETTLVVGTMWESLPLSMEARRSRFFNESEILETLVKLDYDMSLEPGLATEWERVSPQTWRFTLREGVTFHDGTPFDAEAAAYSLERVMALLPYAADLLQIESLEAEGANSLLITTREPFAALPNQLNDAITGIYARSSFGADGVFVSPVGTGPWRFAAYEKQQHTVVERFEGYWGEEPGLERIVYRFIPDHAARTIAVETGEIDLAISPLPADVRRLENDERFQVYAEPTAGLYYGSFNAAADRPTGDVRVRAALNALIDRDLVVFAALDGVGLPATTFFNPDFGLVPAERAPATGHDPALAADLLTQAGYVKEGGAWSKDGVKLTIRILSYTTRTEMPLVTDALAALLREEGVATEVELYTFPGMMDVVRAGTYDISVVFWTPEMTGHPDLHLKSQFHSQAALNDQNWANPEFDRLVDLGRTLDPGAARDEAYLGALQALADDAAVLPLVHNVYTAIARPDVDGFRVHPSGFYHDLKSVTKTARD